MIKIVDEYSKFKGECQKEGLNILSEHSVLLLFIAKKIGDINKEDVIEK